MNSRIVLANTKGTGGRHRALRITVGAGLLWAALAPIQAQWLTQSLEMVSGWNAVFLHVDATHEPLGVSVSGDSASRIEEIWAWDPSPSTIQFVESPQLPFTGSQWKSWDSGLGPASELKDLKANIAYLVKVDDASPTYTWNLKGLVVPPQYSWTSSGLNLLGFPTPAGSPPDFQEFLAQSPQLRQNAQIFEYTGGVLGPLNPAQVFALRTTDVDRGEAFWVRSGEDFNSYFGPFDVILQQTEGALLGETGGQFQIRLRNQTSEELEVTLIGVDSEATPTVPSGLPPVEGAVPVLVRGALDTTDLTFDFHRLSDGPQTWTLAPKGQLGSEVEVVIGVDRSTMGGTPGDLFASVLRFTDDLGLSEIDVPVSAKTASTTGLWVGSASVTGVNHYLKNFAKAETEEDFDALLLRLGLENGVDGFTYEWFEATGRVLVFGGPDNLQGSYLLDGPIKTDLGTVATPFPLRLILHNDGTKTRLLQRAYVGMGLASQPVVATQEALLAPATLSAARRVSAVHLPFSASNLPWEFDKKLSPGQTVKCTFHSEFDDQASNPFLHIYHPDHDNLKADFNNPEFQPRGVESYRVTRTIFLTIDSPGNDFESLTTGGRSLQGSYRENFIFSGVGSDRERFYSRGSFALERILDIPQLTTE